MNYSLPPLDRFPFLDWEKHLRKTVFPAMGKTGGGQWHHTVGTIILNGSYPLRRPLRLSPFHFLLGAHRPGWHLGNSCGFFPHPEEWEGGDFLLEWELPAPGHYYSAFGAGMANIFLECSPGLGGAKFIGSQQGSLVSNIRIRGFGKATGLSIAGDTYRLEDVYLDRDHKHQKTPPPGDGSIGLAHWGARLDSVIASNVTVHNCETGISLGDISNCHIQLETETTRTPAAYTYNAVGSTLSIKATHADRVAAVTLARHGNFDLSISGVMDRTLRRISLPGNNDHWLYRANEPRGYSLSSFRYRLTKPATTIKIQPY